MHFVDFSRIGRAFGPRIKKKPLERCFSQEAMILLRSERVSVSPTASVSFSFLPFSLLALKVPSVDDFPLQGGSGNGPEGHFLPNVLYEQVH